MATRNKSSKEETPLQTIWTNTIVTYWFVCYYFARMIRPFFHLTKPKLTVAEFVNQPHHHLVDVITAE